MSAKFVSNKDETIRLFENPVLEFFTHINPKTPFFVFIPVIALLMYKAFQGLSFMHVLLMFSLGIIAWTLFEYVLHRFVFHYEPKSDWGKKLHFMSHGIHHDYPRDSTRLVMPLGISVPLASLLYVLFGAAGFLGLAMYAGFLLGYLIYDGMHFAVHHVHFQGKIGRFLQSYHLKHHFQDDQKSFGVSSPLWDFVFATMPEKNSKIHSDI